MPQIHLEHVTKYYVQDKRRIAAVREVDLTIEQGEFVFVTGSSGAGKSTLLQLISGEITPSSGTVYLGPWNLAKVPGWRRGKVNLTFGRMPQLSMLIRKRTIGENLELAARLSRVRGASVQARIQKALGVVGMPGVEDRYPAELSLGECRRVELARTLLNDPAILILDEPTANLDEDTGWDIIHLINELNRRGSTVVMATHAKQFVNLLRKRVITLVDGRIWGDVPKGRYGSIV